MHGADPYLAEREMKLRVAAELDRAQVRGLLGRPAVTGGGRRWPSADSGCCASWATTWSPWVRGWRPIRWRRRVEAEPGPERAARPSGRHVRPRIWWSAGGLLFATGQVPWPLMCYPIEGSARTKFHRGARSSHGGKVTQLEHLDHRGRSPWRHRPLLCAAGRRGGRQACCGSSPVERMEMGAGDGQRSWQRYEVGESPVLTLDNFSGSVSVRAGEEGEIEIVILKQARRAGDLERITVDITRTRDGLAIKTAKPPGVGNAGVDFEITAPAGTRLDARTGSGSVRVDGLRGGVKAHSGSGSLVVAGALGGVDAFTGSGRIEVRGAGGGTRVDSGSGSLLIHDVEGELQAHTGSGSIEALGARGPVRLDTGSGSVHYAGSPQGDSRFQSGSGGITLVLPADLDMALDLHTGSGRVEVSPGLDGQITASKGEVKGVVGSGEDGTVWARTGSGNVRVQVAR